MLDISTRVSTYHFQPFPSSCWAVDANFKRLFQFHTTMTFLQVTWLLFRLCTWYQRYISRSVSISCIFSGSRISRIRSGILIFGSHHLCARLYLTQRPYDTDTVPLWRLWQLTNKDCLSPWSTLRAKRALLAHDHCLPKVVIVIIANDPPGLLRLNLSTINNLVSNHLCWILGVVWLKFEYHLLIIINL